MKKLRLTPQEIKTLNWADHENFALVDVEKKEIFIGSDSKEFLRESLQKMTSKHPKYDLLDLVERPE